MPKPVVIILAGSQSDEKHFLKISQALSQFGIEVIIRIASAHKTAVHALSILKKYEALEQPKIYITVAGRSNALSGFVDGAVKAPVIACPPPSESFSGADVFSSLRMPSGIAPALILEPENAALFAAKIFALSFPEIAEKVKLFQAKQTEIILTADAHYV